MSWIFIWWDSSLRRRNYDKKWAWESIFLATWVFMHLYVVWIDALRGIPVKPEFPNLFLLYESWSFQRVAQNAARWKPCSILVKWVRPKKEANKQTRLIYFDIVVGSCACFGTAISKDDLPTKEIFHPFTSTNQAKHIFASTNQAKHWLSFHNSMIMSTPHPTTSPTQPLLGLKFDRLTISVTFFSSESNLWTLSDWG